MGGVRPTIWSEAQLFGAPHIHIYIYTHTCCIYIYIKCTYCLYMYGLAPPTDETTTRPIPTGSLVPRCWAICRIASQDDRLGDPGGGSWAILRGILRGHCWANCWAILKGVLGGSRPLGSRPKAQVSHLRSHFGSSEPLCFDLGGPARAGPWRLFWWSLRCSGPRPPGFGRCVGLWPR